jgi:hypothetical protein
MSIITAQPKVRQGSAAAGEPRPFSDSQHPGEKRDLNIRAAPHPQIARRSRALRGVVSQSKFC